MYERELVGAFGDEAAGVEAALGFADPDRHARVGEAEAADEVGGGSTASVASAAIASSPARTS